jgi:chromate transport protein ChrA
VWVVVGSIDDGSRLRGLTAIAGGVYLTWWFAVELLLPGSFNPLPGRLAVVALSWLLVAASGRSRWVERHLSSLFTAWVCVLVAHYCYLIVGNHGDPTWWIGAFVTFAATSMCLQSRREATVFSVFAFVCVVVAAAADGQLLRSIYAPGLATILLLANLTKRSQVIAEQANKQAGRAREETQRADLQRVLLTAARIRRIRRRGGVG